MSFINLNFIFGFINLPVRGARQPKLLTRLRQGYGGLREGLKEASKRLSRTMNKNWQTLRDVAARLLRANGKTNKFFFLIIFLVFFFFPQNILGISWFTDYRLNKAYQRKDYKKVKDILEKEQVDTPNDAQLNYNLGTAYYKLYQLEPATDSFMRCVKNCSSEQKMLKEFAHFNLGNCLYECCLKLLPTSWEKMEVIEDQKLNTAISQVQGAVENYKNVLVINEKNDKAKVNQKKAQELLDKLLKKRKQQENQQNQKDSKQQKNQQQHKQDAQKQDQQKQNESQEDQSSKNNSEQQQDNQKDSAKKDNNEKEDQQQQQKGHDGAQDSANKADDRTKNEFDYKQDAQKNKDISQKSTHDQDSQKNEQQTARLEEDGTKEEQEMQTQSAFGQEGHGDELKERGFRVILDDLQKDESKMQKMVIKQKSKGQEKRLDINQKPW